MVEAIARTRESESEVRALLDSYCDAVRASDLDGIVGHYAPDVIAYDAAWQLEFRGSTAYRAHWKTCLDMCRHTRFELSAPVIAASGDLAFAHCLLHCGAVDPDGQEQAGWVRVTWALRKRNGSWLISHEHYSVPFDPESGKALFALQPDIVERQEALA